jgi:DNA-binding protein H-NS
MTELQTLLQQRQALDAQIAAQKPLAVAEVRATMDRLGVTWADLGVAPLTGARPRSTRPVKYRDDKGNTWTGVGQRPRWLAEALLNGGTLDQFKV